jgi:hypothetical protein
MPSLGIVPLVDSVVTVFELDMTEEEAKDFLGQLELDYALGAGLCNGMSSAMRRGFTGRIPKTPEGLPRGLVRDIVQTRQNSSLGSSSEKCTTSAE